ncbi:MAG: hypothetical protein AAFU57_18490 [Bacteroidota bacterium]
MAFDSLSDIRQNVISTINSIPVRISQPTFLGTQLGPGEVFRFTVDVDHTPFSLNWVQLTRVRLRIQVDNPTIARLTVPDSGFGFGGPNPFSGSVITDLNGLAFPTGPIDLRRGFIINFPEGNPWYQLISPAEDVPALAFRGRAMTVGNFRIQARIIADVDLNWLFPPNQDSNLTDQSNVAVSVAS